MLSRRGLNSDAIRIRPSLTLTANKPEIENSENGFYGDEPAADPDVDTVESVVGSMAMRTGIDSHTSSRLREPPPMMERPHILAPSPYQAGEMLLRTQSFHSECLSCPILVCLHVDYGGLSGTWESHLAPQPRLLLK